MFLNFSLEIKYIYIPAVFLFSSGVSLNLWHLSFN